MSRPVLQKDSRVVYYAEGQPYKGPFPALVDVVHPVDKGSKSVPPLLDLRVFFGGVDGPPHKKMGVAYTLEPAKHHWGYMPDGYIWPEPAKPTEG